MKREEVIPRALAFLVGAALFFVLPIALGSLRGDDTPLMTPALVAAYGVGGVVLGLRWPAAGWRLGLYLFAIWPPMFLFNLFLTGELLTEGPLNWAGMSRDLIEILSVLVAACLGAEVGAIIGRQRRAKTAGA